MGHSLNGFRCYIGGYGNDLVLLAPSAGALQVLLNESHSLLNERGLMINVGKCAANVFGDSKSKHQNSNIRMAGQEIRRVQKWIYLAVILTVNMSIVPDVDRASGAFLRQFKAAFSKSYYMSTEALCFLFHTCIASFL